jgi:beta-fructofuranosidase
MSLVIPDRWIWDFWLVQDGADHHVFYLQADHAIGHPDERHWNVSVGHAVSRDLVRWTELPDALSPGRPGSWDDASTWTGSVVRHDGRWHLLYTGTSLADGRLVQRVGLARSDDLVSWTKHEGPVLEADPRWYETPGHTGWHDVAWRDPWVFADPDDGCYHALLTARGLAGELFDRGVVGHARSRDLVDWEVLPPLTEPMGFGQQEVPQLVALESRWFLLFSSDVSTQGAARSWVPGTGTYYLAADRPYGPFTRVGDGVLEADTQGSTYAGKVHRSTDGEPVFLAWHRSGPGGRFRGELADPRPVEVTPDGALRIRAEPG